MRSILLIGLICSATFGQTNPASQPVERRSIRTTFDQHAPLASTPESNKRFKWNDKIGDIDLAKESFQVYVPEKYAAGEPYGLLLWISPMAQGGIPSKGWLDVLDEKRLIWVGANNSGNDRLVADRIRLAIEAVYNMKQNYTIDDDRIYVAGFSGGGRCASMSATTFSDVFSGGIFFGGVNFYRNIPAPPEAGDTGERLWQATYYPPPQNLIPEQKRTHRFVLVVGEKDFNLNNTMGVYKSGYLKEGYQHATLIQIPDLPHAIPDGGWFAKAVAALDEPLPKIIATRATTRAAATQQATRQVMTSKPASVPAHIEEPDPAREAEKLLSLARSYIAAGSYGPARARLEKIVATYPNTPQAKDARQLLEAIRGK